MNKEPSALDQVNTRRLMGEIEEGVSKIRHSFVFEPDDEVTRNNIKAVTEQFLEGFKGTGVKDYSVGPITQTYHGWREMYPSLIKRVMAWAGVKVFKFGYQAEQRWFHTVFPFEINYRAEFKSEVLSKEEDGTWTVHIEYEEYADADQAVDVRYCARINTPYTSTNMSLTVTPVMPVSFIPVTISVSAHGAEFES